MHYDKIFINGEWVSPSSSEKIEVENPADKNIVGVVPACNEEDVNKAVAAAKEALKTWQFTPLKKRLELMEKLLKELRSKVDYMADIIVKELGAPRHFAKNTHVIPYLDDMENFIKVMASYPLKELNDDFTIVKEPVGVVAALTPWNFPFGQITKKLAPALLTGCTMVLKPSQNTPLVSYFLAEAVEKVGFPKGVFNLLPGKGADVGDPLAKHPDVDLVTFTGSTGGGKEISRLASDDIKRITLELGGKSPAVVLKGADLDLAVSTVLDKMYLNTGQSCSAFSRIIVPIEIKHKIEEIIIEKTKNYKFGHPDDPDTLVGPLASKKQFDKVKYFIEKGPEEGARMLLGQVPVESEGYFVKPVVFTNVNNQMKIAREEIFGPVLSIISYQTVEEAIEIANDTKFGLSSAVFGPVDDVLDVANRLKAGNVIINHGSTTFKAPFGGFKHSGKGREGGKYGIEEFLEIKTLFM
ncbi:MAG: aldehyde dehydrogenase family protein [Tissierella sp.]|uniref:aldehyde dehydrogenase family protein n=1 Tax=Tissierella sp. TaxID=41274 RepID=UPI003F99DA5E